MRLRIEFTVRGQLPPKKDGAVSMWSKPSERERLVSLRRGAAEALAGAAPLSSAIRLELEVGCPAQSLLDIGDLDSFVAGVCDELMAAPPRTPVGADWSAPDLASLHPSRVIGLYDDGAVVEIVARKVPSNTPEHWYRVVLEET